MCRCGGETRLQASLGDGPGPLTACGRLAFWCSGVATFSPSALGHQTPLPSSRRQRWAHQIAQSREGPVMSRARLRSQAPFPDGVAIQIMQGSLTGEWNW